MKSFGKELEQIRKRGGITQYNLAKELNMSRSHINRIESGERKPNKEMIQNISNILKLDRYSLNKLFVLAGLEPELDNDHASFKICFHLVLELKNKFYLQEAERLVEFGMSKFESMVELHALLANLNLLRRNYEEAIQANEETLKFFDTLNKKEVKDIGITKAEVIHNLGYVYFERGREKFEELEKLTALNWDVTSKENETDMEILKKESIRDFDQAITKIAEAWEIEPDNLHIIDQLARLYYCKAELVSAKEKEQLLKKSLGFYEKLISYNNADERGKKQEASIFLALALGKLNNLEEAARLINTIIVYTPLYYLGYYVKSCIYSINGKKNAELLKTSFEALEESINLNSDIRDQIKWELDLQNLRFDDIYRYKFSKLVSG